MNSFIVAILLIELILSAILYKKNKNLSMIILIGYIATSIMLMIRLEIYGGIVKDKLIKETKIEGTIDRLNKKEYNYIIKVEYPIGNIREYQIERDEYDKFEIGEKHIKH